MLATQCLVMKKAKSMLIRVDGRLPPGVTAKDLVLTVIGRIGTAGGTGHAIEFGGEAVRALSMESRMTMCNMAIEAGARAGMVGVDDTHHRVHQGPTARAGRRDVGPRGRALANAHERRRRALRHHARVQRLRGAAAGDVGHVARDGGVDRRPRAGSRQGARLDQARRHRARARRTWDCAPTRRCRISRSTRCSSARAPTRASRTCAQAAAVARGKRVASNVKLAMVVPGSGLVKAQAEAEGLDRIFRDAGFEWREPGCSMCLAMNDDRLEPGERCASTSNRNFEGRQGAGGRTHLVSPAMAAAAAIEGHFVDVRRLLLTHASLPRPHRSRRAARPRERRHRCDHPQAVPEVDQAIGLRPQSLRRVALPRPRRAGHGSTRSARAIRSSC